MSDWPGEGQGGGGGGNEAEELNMLQVFSARS